MKAHSKFVIISLVAFGLGIAALTIALSFDGQGLDSKELAECNRISDAVKEFETRENGMPRTISELGIEFDKKLFRNVAIGNHYGLKSYYILCFPHSNFWIFSEHRCWSYDSRTNEWIL
jgi:hypothetical protein